MIAEPKAVRNTMELLRTFDEQRIDTLRARLRDAKANYLDQRGSRSSLGGRAAAVSRLRRELERAERNFAENWGGPR